MRYFIPALAAVLAAAGTARADLIFRLRPVDGRAHIQGYLTNAAGQGVRGMVSLWTMDGHRLSMADASGIYGGRFDFDNVLEGRYRLHVEVIGPVPVELRTPPDIEVSVGQNHIARPVFVIR